MGDAFMKTHATFMQRLVVVSNRLPFNVAVRNGDLKYRESSGGLATGLAAYLDSIRLSGSKEKDALWVGWPGNTVEESLRERLKAEAGELFHSYPVFLSEEEMEEFYHGFCNKTIWPLFHYFPTYTIYREEYWQQYKKVNEIYCDALIEVLRGDEVVWIHDYHLMLLPSLLRSRAPGAHIGFFLHIPFPSFEVFRLLPVRWRQEILEGLLGADLLGFHTFDYTQHFLQSVLRILGFEHSLGQLFLPTHVVKVDTFPMGIDYQKYSRAAQEPDIQRERQKLRHSLADSRIVVSVDRLDYSKGILHRLEGFETLLETHPEFRGKVVLVMIVVPSRVMVERYEMMKKQIEELVGKINGLYGSIGWTPVVYQYRYLPFGALTALYCASDVALVTPLRDGMNLVAKEYVSTRTDKSGVMILSEMAGSAKELGEAIIINPNNRDEIANALAEALDMPLEEQQRRMEIMQERLKRYDLLRWANDFLEQLTAMKHVQSRFLAKLLPITTRNRMKEEYHRATRRILFLDYDGTLVAFARRPQLAVPSDEVMSLISRLANDPSNLIVLISGRDKETIDRWFGALPVHLAAEHGVWIREHPTGWRLLKHQTSEWKSRLLPILEHYADRLPGASVEEKEFSLVWHYRAADPEQSRLLVGEMKDNLTTFTANIDVQIHQGNKMLEVRSAGFGKGHAALHWLAGMDFEFILAIGDDYTDEDLFRVLPASAYTIRVGITSTQARYNVRDSRDVIRLLESMPEAVQAGAPEATRVS
jgi:trehalose 6-phosphate synthase/phosphatase